MENKSHALAAGAFVIVVAALLAGLAWWLLRDVANTNAYELVTDDAVTGLQPQAVVRFKGVAVGKVTDISFDPKNHGSVLVRVAVSPDAPITKSTFATLALQGVTGLSFVQLDDPGGSTDPLPPGPDGGPPRIPLRDSTLGQLAERASSLVDKLDKVTDGINVLLSSDNQAALTTALKEIGSAARETAGTAKAVNQLAANTDKTIQTQFGPGGADLSGMVRQATSTLKSIEGVGTRANAAMDNVSAAAVDVRQGIGALTGQGGVIDRLGDSATTVTTNTLPRIQGLTEDVSRTIRRLDRVVDSVSENPQSLIYGGGAIPPGPGEPGYLAPAGP